MKEKITEYLTLLAINARQAKLNVKRLNKIKTPIDVLEFAKGRENEAWNRLQGAKEFFRKS
jgi:hypothetical protein